MWALNIRCFVVKLFSAVLWVNLDLSGIYGVVLANRDIIVDNMEYQRGRRAVTFLKH